MKGMDGCVHLAEVPNVQFLVGSGRDEPAAVGQGRDTEYPTRVGLHDVVHKGGGAPLGIPHGQIPVIAARYQQLTVGRKGHCSYGTRMLLQTV